MALKRINIGNGNEVPKESEVVVIYDDTYGQVTTDYHKDGRWEYNLDFGEHRGYCCPSWWAKIEYE